MANGEDKYILAEYDYISGMKYKDIAEKYGVTINTVKSWKQRYDWSKKGVHTKEKKCAHKNEKGVHTKEEKVCAQNIENRKAAVDSGDCFEKTHKKEELTEKEKLFCLYYIKSFNATQSYLKAFKCSYNTANTEGYRCLVKPRIKNEIDRLKEIKRQQLLCDADDLLEFHMRIAFGDIGDYIDFENHTVKLRNSDSVDTQLIQSVSEGKNGITIKLIDRGKSFDWLDRYFDCNPSDRHRREYDMRKLELECIKLENELKVSESNEPIEDNFIDAMNSIAKEEDWNEYMGDNRYSDKKDSSEAEDAGK